MYAICKRFGGIKDFFLTIFGPILMKHFAKIFDISFGYTIVSFFFNQVGIKLFLFLSEAIDFIPCQIVIELDFCCSK